MQRVLIISGLLHLRSTFSGFDFPFNTVFQVQRQSCREPCRDEMLASLLGGVESKLFILMFQL